MGFSHRLRFPAGLLLFIVIGLVGFCAHGQGVVGDVLSGNLVDPTVGTWAWYNLTDATGTRRYLVRLAIVGEEKVKHKTGYWLEVEVVPQLGFKSVYKMLLTGPAKDPANIHRMRIREGTKPAVEVPLEDVLGDGKETAEGRPAKENSKRKLLGEEEVKTLGGEIRAEHYLLEGRKRKVEVWLNDQVKPMGIVRMTSPDGELVLRNCGEGGNDARSTLDLPVAEFQPMPDNVKVEVRVDEDPPSAETSGESTP